MTMAILETERSTSSHHHRTHGSELFVCFTSRPSSASIKLAPSSSTKASSSMLSPGRADKIRDNPASRRLKASGSIKGQSSPMLFATGKKRNGSAFETQEPTSPKVTCIGQVRVKTKQGKKKMRLGRGNGLGGELSFSKREHPQEDCLPHRNQRWGHIFGFKKEVSFSICEAIREFTCFLPCTSSNDSAGKASAAGKDGSKEKDGVSTACGPAFAKWLMVWLDGDEKRMRDEVMPVVAGGGAQRETVVVDEDEDEEEIGEKCLRVEQVSRDMEVCFNEAEKYDGEEEDKVVVPPRNALLLMRCRSDPVRMAALANRFWESPGVARRDEDEEEDEDGIDDDEEKEDEDERENLQEEQQGDEEEVLVTLNEEREEEEEEETEITDYQKDCEEFLDFDETHVAEEDETVENNIEQREAKEDDDEEESENEEVEILEDQVKTVIKEECEQNEILHEMALDIVDNENFAVQQNTDAHISLSPTDSKDGVELLAKEEEQTEQPPELKAEKVADDEETEEIHQRCESTNTTEESNQDTILVKDEETKQQLDKGEPLGITILQGEDRERKEDTRDTNKTIIVCESHQEEDKTMVVVKECLVGEKRENEQEEDEGEKPLPDCLLLMMYEPKLSMEVSKETWVCSRDFLWHRPRRQERKKQQDKERDEEKERNKDEEENRRVSTDERPQKKSPSMAKLIEQKLVNAYEPFALTRCKSEPLRSTSMSVVPETCFWKTRKFYRPYLGMGF